MHTLVRDSAAHTSAARLERQAQVWARTAVAPRERIILFSSRWSFFHHYRSAKFVGSIPLSAQKSNDLHGIC